MSITALPLPRRLTAPVIAGAGALLAAFLGGLALVPVLDEPLWRTVGVQAPNWILWGLLVLPVRAFTRRLAPIGRSAWALHLATGLTLALVQQALLLSVAARVGWGPFGELAFGSSLSFDLFAQRFPLDVAIYWLVVLTATRPLGAARAETRPAAPEKARAPSDGAAKTWPRRLALRASGAVRFVEVDRIEWIEAADQYVRIHDGGEAPLVRGSLKALESELDPGRFLRVHRSAIVALDRVRALRTGARGRPLAVLASGREVPVARRRREALERRLLARR